MKLNIDLKKLHLMWLFVWIIFGLSGTILFNETMFLVISTILGLFFMLTRPATPSKVTGFKKGEMDTLIVWILVILSVSMLILSRL